MLLWVCFTVTCDLRGTYVRSVGVRTGFDAGFVRCRVSGDAARYVASVRGGCRA